MESEQSAEVVSENEKPSALQTLHIETPLSKYLAMALFVVLPFLGGWVGYNLAPEKVVEVEKIVVNEVEPETVQSEDWLTYRNDEYGFKFNYPAHLKLHESSKEIRGQKYLASFSSTTPTTSDSFNVYGSQGDFMLDVRVVQNVQKFDEFYRQANTRTFGEWFNTYQLVSDNDNFGNLSIQELMINGYKAYMQEYELLSVKEGPQRARQELFLEIDIGTVLSLEADAPLPKGREVIKIFEDIIETLVFLESEKDLAQSSSSVPTFLSKEEAEKNGYLFNKRGDLAVSPAGALLRVEYKPGFQFKTPLLENINYETSEFLGSLFLKDKNSLYFISYYIDLQENADIDSVRMITTEDDKEYVMDDSGIYGVYSGGDIGVRFVEADTKKIQFVEDEEFKEYWGCCLATDGESFFVFENYDVARFEADQESFDVLNRNFAIDKKYVYTLTPHTLFNVSYDAAFEIDASTFELIDDVTARDSKATYKIRYIPTFGGETPEIYIEE